MEIIWGIFRECWHLLAESALFVLFGFFVAGFVKAFLPDEIVARHLGRNSVGSVIKASLLGIPLPLCSCGVIPAAIELRRQGAGKGASAAFLISTPESGVDSIAITWALLDPIMTMVRPVAAFVTATVAGLLINRLPEEAPTWNNEKAGCGCQSGCGREAIINSGRSFWRRVKDGLAYAFGDLLGDIGRWLLLGIAVAGTISWALPDDFLAVHLGSEGLSLAAMLVAGVPLYICATASTPIAAALVLKGLSPGAALVFLLAGPATNAATVTVIGRYWGRRVTGIYLVSIAVCALSLGWLTNRLYAWTGIDIATEVHPAVESPISPFMTASAVLLLVLIGRKYLPQALISRTSAPK